MTDVIQENIRCPRCSVESPLAIWRSLDVTPNPAEKHSLSLDIAGCRT